MIRTWNLSGRRALMLFTCSTLWLCIGCPSKPQSQNPTESSNKSETTKVESAVDTDSILETIVAMIDQSRDNMASFVGVFEHANQYMELHKDQIKPLEKDTVEKIEKIFGAGASAEAVRKEFAAEDRLYIRQAMFLQEVVNAIPRGDLSDPAYAEKVMDWVARYVFLTKIGALEYAWPREVCIRGTGSVFERSWLFIELLRQAGLQACVIGVPTSDKQNPISTLLCGLIVGEDVYLYDPTYGIPVPSAKKGIATLKELNDNPKLIEYFSVDPKLPAHTYKPADLKNFSLLLVLEPRMFAPRMKFLESKLTGKLRTNLSVDMDSVLSRAQTALAKIPNSNGVRVWKFPLNTDERLRNERSAYIELLKSGNIVWWQLEEAVRLTQLRGQHLPAVQKLAELQIDLTPAVIDERLRAMRAPDSERQKSVSNTRFDIFYFIGLGKLDDPAAPNLKDAANWFKRYYDNESSADLTASDILSWGSLVQKFSQEAAKPVGSPAKRVWELLDEKSRIATKQIADRRLLLTVWQKEMMYIAQLGNKMKQDSEEAGTLNMTQFLEFVELEGQRMTAPNQDPPTQNFGNTLLQMVENVRKAGKEHNAPPKSSDFENQLRQQGSKRQAMFAEYSQKDDADKELLLANLNKLLKRPDMFRPADVASLPAAEIILGRPRASNSAVETLKLNRDLLAVGLPTEIATRRQLWTAGAIRNRATALKRMGKMDEAQTLLKTPVADLQPSERAELQVLAKYWLKS